MTQNHIIRGIFVGDIDDAREWKGNKLCVTEKYPTYYSQIENSILIPILSRANQNQPTDKREMIDAEDVHVLIPNLDLVAHVIQNHVDAGEELLVHCVGGMERSPLALTWYLHSKMGLDLDRAFDYVKKRRPQAMNRIQWLNITSYKER